VAAWGKARSGPAKPALRELGRKLLPASIADAPKAPQLAPEMNLAGVAEQRHLDLAARVLPEVGRADVRLVSLALLHRHFPRLLE
jgi:hypothetical protein